MVFFCFTLCTISFLEENESIQVVKEILKNMYLHRTQKALKQDEVSQQGVQHTLLERQGASPSLYQDGVIKGL